MNTEFDTTGTLHGICDELNRTLCRSTSKESGNTAARQADAILTDLTDESGNWSGQPGQDLFFNGWKLLF